MMRRRFLPSWGSRSGFRFSTPEFHAGFDDAGAGVVNTTLSRGIGPATFTRATTATTVGSTGLVIKGVASGSPRSYYDPTTLAYQGYLAEGARTNICLQSEDLATTWSNTRSTETVNATTAPDGTATADKLVEDATAANNHFVSQTITITDAIHTFSVWLKQAERTWAAIDIFDGTTNVRAFFNLATGAAGATSNGSSTIKAFPNGWYRCTLTSTLAMVSGGSGGVRVLLAEGDNDVTYDGNGTSGIYVWGAQLEAATFASSYIPTTTAAVTRNADVLTYPFAGNADATRGWVYAETTTLWAGTFTGITIGFATGTAGQPLTQTNDTSVALSDGTTANTKSGTASTNTGIRKRSSAWGGSTTLVTADGLAPNEAAFDGAMNSAGIGIGCDANGGNELFGTLKNVRIGIVKPTDAQLVAITA